MHVKTVDETSVQATICSVSPDGDLQLMASDHACLITPGNIYRISTYDMKVSDWLPILGIASGIFALYVDPKQNPKWRGVAIAGILLAAFITVGANYNDSRAERRSQDQYQQAMDHLNSRFDTLMLVLMQSNGVREPLSAASDPKQTNLILDATKARQLAVAKLPATSANNLAIEYFPHFTSDVNPTVVKSALEQIGVSVREKQGNAVISDLATNCIWIGDKVTADEARAVALTLIAAGVPLRDIRSLEKPSGPNARLIEIGSSAKVLSMPALTPEDLSSRAIPSKP